MNKSIFLSKTFWVNLIAGMITVAGIIDPTLLNAIGIDDPTRFITIMGSITALLNIVLRFLTSKSVSLLGGSNE